jgi:O-antigen/teichoic acid export membrane protein
MPNLQVPWPTRLRRKLGVDRAIAFTVLARGWAGIAGLVTVALIARSLTSAEQGYYFTFGSLVAMQLVFELGFSVVILQLATHECAHLTLGSDGTVTGSLAAHARLASVLQKSVRWYSVAALLMVSILIPAGLKFFGVQQAGVAHVDWVAPWCLLVFAAGFTFQIDPVFSFLEGCGYVANVAHTRFWQAACGAVLAWAALASHHGLYAPAMMICGQALAGVAFLYSRRALLVGLLRFDPKGDRIDWWQEVWPFQWRIAVSYSCGFFIFQLFNPVLFKFWGPVAAGQMGMSLSIGNMLASVAIAWVNTKAAPFGGMIARREFRQLDHVFFKAVAQTTLLCSVGAAVIWLGCLFLNLRGLPFSHRMLPPLPFGLLLLSVICNQLVSAAALYLRAHKQEKFLLNSILGAIFTGASTYFLGQRFGALGVTAGYLAVTLVVGIGLGGWTFMKYRREWHLA